MFGGNVFPGLGVFTRTGTGEEAAKRIAVVNVARVFNAYQRVADVREKMRKLFDAEYKAIENSYNDLRTRQNEIDVKMNTRNPKTDIEFLKEVQAFELDKLKLENRHQNMRQKEDEQNKNEMKTVLNDIKSAIRTVGTAEKFDLVLRAPEYEDEFDPAKAAAKDKEDKDKVEPQTAADLVFKFRQNPVLYFATGVDITQKVIEQLNEDYKKTAPK